MVIYLIDSFLIFSENRTNAFDYVSHKYIRYEAIVLII